MAVDIGEALARAPSTGRLDLTGRKLGSVPSAIRELRNLEHLHLVDCGLENLPDWIGELTNLQTLGLAENPLIDLPPSIHKLTSLRELGLRCCAFTQLPDWIGELTNLQTLGLGGNPFGQVPPAIRHLKKLRELGLRSCGITQLPDWIGELTNLQALNLADNRLEHVPQTIRHLINLRELNLWGCGVVELPHWIGELVSLQTLELGNNLISRLPPELGALRSLRRLYLQGNMVGRLPDELVELRNLAFLSLTGNPLHVPPEILDQPERPSAVLDYLARTSDLPTRRLDEAKVLVVGEGAVGKTSLINRLVLDRFSNNEPKTHGIDVTTWSIDLDGIPIRLNVWDFGGQEYMHATHQFFFTKRSVYVLVVDSRHDEEQNRIEYWLKLIQSLSDHSPVIVVGNKTDQAPLDIDTRGLRSKYADIVDICTISCKNGDGITELQELLTDSIDQLPNVRDLLPEAFFDVKAELEEFEANYLPYRDYEHLCERHGVTTANSKELLVQFLHDLGTVLCFRDDPRLADTPILNPRWVTGGVYRILNDHRAHQKTGLLTWDDIDAILDGESYPHARRAVIVDMMKRFELCFDSEGTFLIPDLLAREEPDTGTWDGSLQFEISYEVLPSSIISRLIVRLHPHISRGTVWRTGAVFSMDSNRARVQADRESRLVKITVDGPSHGRRGLLTAIRTELRAIQKTIPGLKSKERLPVPGHPGYWVPYEHLRKLEDAGRRTVVPEGLIEEFHIRQLLDGVEEPSARFTVQAQPIGATDTVGPVTALPSQPGGPDNSSTPTHPDKTNERLVSSRSAKSASTQATAAAPDAAGPAWTAPDTRRFGWLLVAVAAILVTIFVVAALLIGTPAASAITTTAIAGTALIGMLMLRSSKHVSENGLLSWLKHLFHSS